MTSAAGTPAGQRLTAVADTLEEPLRAGLAPLTVPAAHAQQASDQRHAATRERATLLAEIRVLPDFADFLKPPPAAGLLGAAQLGPVVMINVSRHRSTRSSCPAAASSSSRCPA